ncbi:MAG: class I SAM-dependent methyltransferase [Microthrixaceae bacterium]
MVEKSQWVKITEENPDHSKWYIERFRTMAAEGADLAGEARMVDAMVGRNSRILDAGCGPGRLGGYLFQQGHEVVGVDVDPKLIEAAEADHPGPRWLVGDLAELDLASQHGISAGFDVILNAGNVMTFLAPSTRALVVERLAAHLAPGGRLVIGFGAGRGYEFSEFFEHTAAAGLGSDLLLSTWDLRPFTDSSDFLVAVLSR